MQSDGGIEAPIDVADAELSDAAPHAPQLIGQASAAWG